MANKSETNFRIKLAYLFVFSDMIGAKSVPDTLANNARPSNLAKVVALFSGVVVKDP